MMMKSTGEREVFLHNIRLANSRAKINFINGLSGQGSSRLSSFIASSEEISTVSDKFLRFTMPAASCNFLFAQIALPLLSSEMILQEFFDSLADQFFRDSDFTKESLLALIKNIIAQRK